MEQKFAGNEIIKLLDYSVVRFYFKRVTYDMKPRWATGTRNLDIISVLGGDIPSSHRQPTPGLITFFDLGTRFEWRMCYLSLIDKYEIYYKAEDYLKLL